jgi:hypothetical protein
LLQIYIQSFSEHWDYIDIKGRVTTKKQQQQTAGSFTLPVICVAFLRPTEAADVFTLQSRIEIEK